MSVCATFHSPNTTQLYLPSFRTLACDWAYTLLHHSCSPVLRTCCLSSLVGCHNNCFAPQQDAAEVIGYLGERLPFLRGIRMVTEYECSKCNFRKPEEDQRVAYVPICVSASMLQCCVCVVVCARVFACACACVPCSCVRMSVCVCSGVSVCGPRRPTRVLMAPMNCGRDLSTVHGRCACEHNESGFSGTCSLDGFCCHGTFRKGYVSKSSLSNCGIVCVLCVVLRGYV